MLMVETCFSWNWLVIFLSGSWRNFRVRWRRLLWYFGSHDTEWFACFLIFGCIFDHADHVDELPQMSSEFRNVFSKERLGDFSVDLCFLLVLDICDGSRIFEQNDTENLRRFEWRNDQNQTWLRNKTVNLFQINIILSVKKSHFN